MTSLVESIVTQSRHDLKATGVLNEGHFERHDGRHTKWYFSTEPLVFGGAIWRIAQDLAGIVPEIVDEIEIVSGPQSIGDAIVVSVANVISSRGHKARHVNCVPIERQFEIVGEDLGKTVYRVRPYYTSRLKGKKVLFVDNVYASGKTAVKCLRLLESYGAEIIGQAYIADLSLIPDKSRSALWTEEYNEVYDKLKCPMCRDGIPITKF